MMLCNFAIAVASFSPFISSSISSSSSFQSVSFRGKSVHRDHSSRMPLTKTSASCLVTRHCRHYRASTSLFLNRFLLDPYELMKETDSTTDIVNVPMATLPATDYRTIHAAKILRLQNGDTLRAGIVLDQQPSLQILGGGKKKVDTEEGENCQNLQQEQRHPYAGWVTDHASVTWLPEGKIKNPWPTKLGEPPGSLQIRLDRLYYPGEDNTDNTQKESWNAPPVVSLLLALPRPLQLARLLPMISQLGVNHLILCAAHKVPNDYFGSHLFRKPNELRKCLLEGLCQSGDVRLPRVTVVKSPLQRFLSQELLEDWFPSDQVARVVAHPLRKDTTTSTKLLCLRDVAFPNPQQKQILIAVGPEGGWLEPDELELLQHNHFQQVTLGQRTLRTDVAVISLLALAQDVCSS